MLSCKSTLHWRKSLPCCLYLQSVKDVEEVPSKSGEAQPPSLPQLTPENYSQVRNSWAPGLPSHLPSFPLLRQCETSARVPGGAYKVPAGHAHWRGSLVVRSGGM